MDNLYRLVDIELVHDEEFLVGFQVENKPQPRREQYRDEDARRLKKTSQTYSDLYTRKRICRSK